MIVHKVTTEKLEKDHLSQGAHKRIYVGCAEPDIPRRDMMIGFRQRWQFYINNTFDFLTSDGSGLERDRWKRVAEKNIHKSDAVMILVSEHTASDFGVSWEIDCALKKGLPIVGVDIRKRSAGGIPKGLAGKMTRYGWEWFAMFIDGL
ncbi:conserved hypothetical protein [delta proteobacterium NaphS2]|nr:conserved hypothetical protein [delta proteobacterium NaphS2]